jgi:REP element-mobilizing transposase RayT
MTESPYVLVHDDRVTVIESLREVCAHRAWILIAAHARRTHVHTIVEAEVRPEVVMNVFKAYASRKLNRTDQMRVKRWARHGSTRWLWNDDDVRTAIQYIVDGQGTPMVVYNAEAL